MNDKDALFLSSFYPEEVKITQVIENNSGITIFLKSLTHSHVCPQCGQITKIYHSTYRRRIQDLPILGKSVYLNVTAYRYKCENTSCEQKVFCEELSGFTGKYRRMTSRLEDFIITLALNTSCEGTARICKALPQAMQIADRFHLHQNLLKAIKDALGREVPAKIMIPSADSPPTLSDSPVMDEPSSKKNELTNAEKNRKETIIKIQSYLSQGYTSKSICEMLKTTYTN